MLLRSPRQQLSMMAIEHTWGLVLSIIVQSVRSSDDDDELLRSVGL